MKKRHPLHPHTAIINKAQKLQSKKIRNQALEWLAATFPEAFDTKTRIRPLKIGIMNDILQWTNQAASAGISRSKLREAVISFTRRLDYLTCVKAQEMRIDLNGNPLCRVSAEEAELAASKIKKRIEKCVRITKQNSSDLSAAPQDSKYTNTPSSHFIRAAVGTDTSTLEQTSFYPNPSPTNNVARATTVIKHKVTRSYDPGAVARLKEKLGLTQRAKSEETTE